MDRDAIISGIKRVAKERGLARLSQREYCSITGTAPHVIARHFDRWSEACSAAGIACETNDKIVPNYGPTLQECLDDMVRVARELGTTTLTRDNYKKHGRWSSLSPIYRHFGDWPSALDAAGLKRHSSYHEAIPFDVLASEFIQVASDVGRLPTIRELKRRSSRKWERFTAKHGGYDNFKLAIARWYVAGKDTGTTSGIGEALSALLARHSATPTPPQEDPAPHRRGNVLGFRQFAYAPTQEQDVVAIFNSVAEELGFEIIANRVRFPDCHARERQPGKRKHYLECRIEFEFRSSDFRSHGHPVGGCDLIVCWEHDWNACPLRVLDLCARIRLLKGWR